MNENYNSREQDIISYFQDKEKYMQECIQYLERRREYEYRTDEEILQGMDIKTIEKFLRKEKLKNITNEHINN